MSFDESDLGALDVPQIHAGKVRRLYAWPADESGRGRLLMVATDAVSAYDHVLSRPIPDKGAVLTQLSQWWFAQLDEVVDNHVLSTDVPAVVEGRAVICEALEMFPVECVARGYLTGSGWAEYQASRTVCGIDLPEGLHDGSRLPEPIFTPATKAELGEHDENIDFARMVDIVGAEAAERLRTLTLAIYARAEQIARERGIILADTKVEFGRRPDGTIVLADEVLTPDSSRFWDATAWQEGSLESFDKQYLRDWLTRESGWDKGSDAPPPPLPDDVVTATRERYLEAYQRLTGSAFVPAGAGRISPMAKIVVDVMPKPEILDPQGKAVTGALQRLGHSGLTVRQGKRFEIEVDGEITDARLDEVRQAAETLLANTVIEQFDVRVEEA
ncbi:phosphoribosylaminoimidazolesuccinocarboxamide synthase [Aestuariimicrobium kwangyangense]|uniref:phosphoribosylaminoimidazolesuccinocarboxamide synthase n=1 Tax=Aestuariimicrobium kwangyangense TaxID=396389 RepID=UPI00040EE9F8|nr:phosphoribosylaminoimidazolesuccinocarboxamide synthase [Aestuariimicrobium kwangyangense]